MCICPMLVSRSSSSSLLGEENTPSLLWHPMPSQEVPHTLWSEEIYCLTMPLGSLGSGSRTSCHSTPQHCDTEEESSALTTAFFWLFSSLCKTHVWSQIPCWSVRYRRRKKVWLSFLGTEFAKSPSSSLTFPLSYSFQRMRIITA